MDDGAGAIDREQLDPPSAIGHVAEFDRIIETASLDDALEIAARIMTGWRRGADAHARLPRRLADSLDRIYRKLAAPADGGIDAALRVGTDGIMMAGRIAAGRPDHLREAALVSLFGRRIALPLPLPARHAGPADGKGAFLVFVEIPDFHPEERLWFVEATLADGTRQRLPFTCPLAPRPIDGIKAVLGLVDPQAPELPDLFRDVIAPAVETFWAEARRDRPGATEISYGERSVPAQVSVIVPLYGRIDFVHHQIAAFSNDPELRSDQSPVEFIYVLDDPTLSGAFQRLCRHVHDIYRVPFRALRCDRNLGYSGANNLGARAASGSVLLLLNSDVLPQRGRWIGQLLKTYRALPRCGILGCRLLLEDGSLQHAGMSFRPSAMLPGGWENHHPAKGLPTTFDCFREPARVPAVTGACLMIDRALFLELGGLSEEYVLGDFEDSDLCLKALGSGWDTYYTPEVALYHLERQSLQLLGAADWRQVLTLYNMWKHSRKWGTVIPEALARSAAPPQWRDRDRPPEIGTEFWLSEY